MEKIIFLDVDGVLNDATTMLGLDVDLNDDFPDRPMKKHVDCLKAIVDQTGAKIVLISTWRIFKISRDVVAKELAKAGLEIFSWTKELQSRPDEIITWLKEHPETDRFVILDDEPLSYSFPKNLVRTTFEKGLCVEHIHKAVEILNK